MLFCSGVSPSAAPVEGNYDGGDARSFPEELTNSVLLLLQSWAFSLTCSRAGSSMHSAKGLLPGNRAIR